MPHTGLERQISGKMRTNCPPLLIAVHNCACRTPTGRLQAYIQTNSSLTDYKPQRVPPPGLLYADGEPMRTSRAVR
jgi:hypothetical protein